MIDTRSVALQEDILNAMGVLDTEISTTISEEKADIRVTTFNIDGLDDLKLDALSWYAATTNTDVMFLVDTGLLLRNSEHKWKVIKEKMEQLTKEKWIIFSNAAGPEGAAPKQRTGGQICLVRGYWEDKMRHVRYDGTGPGFLMSLELLINQQPVLISNGY